MLAVMLVCFRLELPYLHRISSQLYTVHCFAALQVTPTPTTAERAVVNLRDLRQSLVRMNVCVSARELDPEYPTCWSPLVDPSLSRLRLLLEKIMNIVVGGYLCERMCLPTTGQCKGGGTAGAFQLTRALEAQTVAGNFLVE